jgi:tripartite-type tricarboxylate transporter receptor subunit TctC
MNRIVWTVMLTAFLVETSGEAGAQVPPNYPAKPIRFIVGFPPGGTNDIVARLLGQKLSEQTGQTFIIDNRAGANTAIASELFVRTPPDGYTIMLTAPGHATNPALMKLKFDPLKDFSFITIAAASQICWWCILRFRRAA